MMGNNHPDASLYQSHLVTSLWVSVHGRKFSQIKQQYGRSSVTHCRSDLSERHFVTLLSRSGLKLGSLTRLLWRSSQSRGTTPKQPFSHWNSWAEGKIKCSNQIRLLRKPVPIMLQLSQIQSSWNSNLHFFFLNRTNDSNLRKWNMSVSYLPAPSLISWLFPPPLKFRCFSGVCPWSSSSQVPLAVTAIHIPMQWLLQT